MMVYNEHCFLATHGVYERGVMPPCHGSLIRAHLIPKHTLKYTLKSNKPVVDIDVWDQRLWVPACGGYQGNAGHHGMFDTARTLRIPRPSLPPPFLELMEEMGLMWWVDRTYPLHHVPLPLDPPPSAPPHLHPWPPPDEAA